MKFSWIKYEKDNENFKIPERLGFDVFRIKNPEQVDLKIEQLVQNKYDTIILSNELASFSSDIIKKYTKDRGVKIIISRNKE